VTAITEPAPQTVDTRAAEVEVDRLHVALGDRPVLRDVSLSVRQGQSVALVGPNGAGKSTLLRALSGLIRPAAGTIRVAGQEMTPGNLAARRLIGLVGHQPMLYPELSASENLRFYGRLYGLGDLEARIERGLRRFNLTARADSPVSSLSRGMVQRLTLIRAMLHEPLLLLLDEPDAGLDASAAQALTIAIQEHADDGAVVFASHDLHRVHALADAVAFLIGGRVAATIETASLTVSGLQDRYADLVARGPSNPQRRLVPSPRP
jgi:heme exporter protein A